MSFSEQEKLFFEALNREALSFVRRAPHAQRQQLEFQLRDLLRDPRIGCPHGVTVFYVHHATQSKLTLKQLAEIALRVELQSNATQVVDEMMGRTLTYNEGALYKRFGKLDAYMVAGYMSANAFAQIAAASPRASLADFSSVHDTTLSSLNRAGPLGFEMRLHIDTIQTMALARCSEAIDRDRPKSERTNGYYNDQLPAQYAQWRSRTLERRARLFELSASLGAQSERLRSFGLTLGLAFSADQDIQSVGAAPDYGVPVNRALQHGVLSVPAVVAHRNDPSIERLFLKGTPLSIDERNTLLTSYKSSAYEPSKAILRRLTLDAKHEARLAKAKNADFLSGLVDKIASRPGEIEEGKVQGHSTTWNSSSLDHALSAAQ